MIRRRMIVVWAVRNGDRLPIMRSRVVVGRVWQPLPLSEGSVGSGETSRYVIE